MMHVLSNTLLERGCSQAVAASIAGGADAGHLDAHRLEDYDSPGDSPLASHHGGERFAELADDEDLAHMPLASSAQPDAPGHRRTIRSSFCFLCCSCAGSVPFKAWE